MSIKRYIPDFITSLNLLCGVLGVIFVFQGRTDVAFVLMLMAAVFDFCDGFSARMLGAYSDLGKELDSLSDLVSFGVLPAMMLFKTSASSCCCGVIYGEITWWSLFPVLIAVFSGVRLAKFNVDPRQSSSFIGLPTPACAMICGSLAFFAARQPESCVAAWCSGPVFISVLSVALSYLLVSEIPMFSMKIHKGEPKDGTFWLRISFLAVVAICAIVVAAVRLNWSLIVLLSFLSYVILNVVFDLVTGKKC